MINETTTKELLKEALKEYVRLLEINDLSYTETRGQVQAYCKVLEINIKYLDLIKAKELLGNL